MMAPWDSKMRWQFGGNLQRVRLICERNWRECPLAIASHIWSEFVTDVVECVTNEGILLRLIILILVCTILLHTIWTRAQWITDSIISKDGLNRVDYKVQDLELRVNVLTYKMQYGAWPSPQQINDTNIGEVKDDVRLSLPSSGCRRYSWLNRCLESVQFKNRHISRSENLGLRLRKPKALIETSKKIYYNRPSEIRELQLFNDASNTRKRLEKLVKIEKGQGKYIEAMDNNEKCNVTREIQDSTKENKKQKSIMKKHGQKKANSMPKNSLKKSKESYISFKSVHDNAPINTTAESSCEDSGNPLSDSPNINSKMKMIPRPSAMKKFGTSDSSASFKRINSTQETLANVKERLESLHAILKTYGSQHNLEPSEKEDVKKELAKAFIQDFTQLRTETGETDEKSSVNIVSEPIGANSVDEQQAKSESVNTEINENDQIVGKKNEEKNSQIPETNDEMKSPTLIDTDEDLGSLSSPPEPSKGGSDSDKSTQSSDALMLNALLNQLDLSNLKRWNNRSTSENTEDDSEGETANIFPKIKNFYQSKLLDIISEEQSGSSCTERASRTIVQSKIPLEKNYPLPNSQIELNEEILNNANVEIKPLDFGIKNHDDNSKMHEVTQNIMNESVFDSNVEISELPNEFPQAKSETLLNTVKSISPWENLLEYSSEESIGNYAPNTKNFHWQSENENITSKPCNISELHNLFDTQNGEQLIDISNLTLKRRPGFFFLAKSTNTSECDNQSTHNQDSDLIDLNYDDNESIIRREEIISNNESNVPLSLMDVTDDILNIEDIDCRSDTLPLTGRTVICAKETNDNNNIHAIDDDKTANNHQSNEICLPNTCKNSNSINLIELERIAYEELTQAENSWDNEWASKNSYEGISTSDAEARNDGDKKLQSYGKKSSLNILSSPSSVYLTVQGSLPHMSIGSNQCIESIEKIEMPEEVKNIDNVEEHVTRKNKSIIVEPHTHCDYNNKSADEIIARANNGKDNEDEECTVISKDSALSETPQQSIITDENNDSNEKFMNAEISSINSSTETSSYADADSHNLIFSSGVSLSFDPPELSQSSEKVTALSSSSSKKASTNASMASMKTAKRKSVMKKVETKTLNKPKLNNKKLNISVKAKSNLNLTKEDAMNLQTKDTRTVEFGQRRSKSYITPRKHEVSLEHRDSSKVRLHNSITKFNNSETRMTNSKNNLIDRLSNSKIKIDRTNSFSKSRESVNKLTSKSCIPVLKTRFDATKNFDYRPRSPSREPLTMSVDIERNSMEINKIDEPLCTDKNDNGDNETKVRHERIDNVEDNKHPLTVPEGQTVIYVNIVTDHENCVTKIVDPKKFLECVKDKDFNIQEIVNENCSINPDDNNGKQCSNSKFVTVISSTGKNSMSFYRQREIEVLAKPSVIDTSTSISDLVTNHTQPKELTEDEYIALLKTLEHPSNLYEYQKMRQVCSKLESDSKE